MKKNILVLTSIYPGNGLPSTYTWVVHYLAREWVKLGFNVKVIHSCTYFPDVYYKTPQSIKNLVSKFVGFTIPSEPKKNIEHYFLDDVEVYRLPIQKKFPMGAYSKEALDTQVSRIEEILKKNKFIPDAIASHWVNPQLYLSAILKNKHNSITSMVIHERIKHFKLLPGYRNLIKSIDCWGFRSLFNKTEFESVLKIYPRWFRCYSGIPSEFISAFPKRNFKSSDRVIFVGQLLPRKYPDVIIKAVKAVYKDNYYRIRIIGDGPMQKDLTKLTSALGVCDKVKLLGRLERNEVIKNLDDSDIFIMVSRGEVFGLVYLEAMARKCIVIASKGEGMEGIINDGENGFLCSAGNEKELSEILSKIRSLSPSERQQIAENGYETALKLTDREVAKSYIETVFSHQNK